MPTLPRLKIFIKKVALCWAWLLLGGWLFRSG